MIADVIVKYNPVLLTFQMETLVLMNYLTAYIRYTVYVYSVESM